MRFSPVHLAARTVCAAVALAVVSPAKSGDDMMSADGTVQVAEATAAGQAVPAPAPAARTLRTRFVIGLDRKTDYQVFSLAEPNRVVIELPDVQLQLPPEPAANSGLVRSFRGGLAAPGKTRVVIDVSQPVVVEKAAVEKDATGRFRLALDIAPVDAALKNSARKAALPQPSGLGAAGLQPPLPKRAENPKVRAAKAFKPIIVLDPGHGGMDSGASKRGTVEKDVVLAFGHELREQLEKTGRYKVLMTRDKDIFIELDERRAMAERNSANLFIAIHADYASSRARGATIFTLRDGVAKDLERSSKRGGEKVLSANELSTLKKAAPENSGAVTSILADLAERDVERTKERTEVFAKTVIENMGESTPMRHNPDQQAAFRVLKTAQFPSVLIELGYVTNREDADNLNSEEWRARVAESIVSAIENYFSNQVAHLPM